MHAVVEDAGRYTCVVSNSAGEERKNFDLDILGKVCVVLCCCVCFFVAVYGFILCENVQI